MHFLWRPVNYTRNFLHCCCTALTQRYVYLRMTALYTDISVIHVIQYLYSLTLTNCMNGQWSYKWQMSFSVSKCCILSIHRKRTPRALNYTFNNTLLNVVNSHSYFGVTVSSDLR